MNMAHNKDKDFDAVLTVSSSINHYNEWILDSGYSYHMSPYRDWFFSLEEFDGGVVLMGNDNAKLQVVHLGTHRAVLYKASHYSLRGIELSSEKLLLYIYIHFDSSVI